MAAKLVDKPMNQINASDLAGLGKFVTGLESSKLKELPSTVVESALESLSEQSFSPAQASELVMKLDLRSAGRRLGKLFQRVPFDRVMQQDAKALGLTGAQKVAFQTSVPQVRAAAVKDAKCRRHIF